ncbi:hypothetical protein BS78_08G032500 [Paspalum vaginatum]|nr:hypothetical protein BS78_08G032500 [Paspalum vaginatum]
MPHSPGSPHPRHHTFDEDTATTSPVYTLTLPSPNAAGIKAKASHSLSFLREERERRGVGNENKTPVPGLRFTPRNPRPAPARRHDPTTPAVPTAAAPRLASPLDYKYPRGPPTLYSLATLGLSSLVASPPLLAPMADCFALEAVDDLHRRWLPREIFADIGIVDPEPPAAAEPESAAAAGVEELAAQLAGILGGGSKACPLVPSPPPLAAQVCGLQDTVVAACGAGAGKAAVAWPFVPYPPVQWQVASGPANLGGVLGYDYPAPAPPALPCRVPPPASLRGGTGVFLPRADAYYRHAAPAPAKGGVATSRPWGGSGRPATGTKQEWQNKPTATHPQQQAGGPEVALPQDWSYR